MIAAHWLLTDAAGIGLAGVVILGPAGALLWWDHCRQRKARR